MKRLFERTLAFVGACVMCIGVTSCGNDVADQSAQPPASPVHPETVTHKPAVPSVMPLADERDEHVDSIVGASGPSPVTGQPPASSGPVDEWAELESLKKVARQLNSDFLTPARAWAGNSMQKKLGVCEIAKGAGRAADLVMLAREARAACTGKDATFGHLWRVVKYFEAGAALDEAREALDKAVPLADTPARKGEVAKAWRRLWAK